MRRAILTLHLTVALIAGAFLVTLGLTGAVMAFETELGHVLNAHLSYVMVSGTPLSLAEMGTAASRVMPGQRISGFVLPAAPNLSCIVQFRSQSVYVNPYTGDVLGVRTAGPDLLSRIHQLHLRLLLTDRHDSGKTIVRWAGVAMLILVATGLYL